MFLFILILLSFHQLLSLNDDDSLGYASQAESQNSQPVNPLTALPNKEDIDFFRFFIKSKNDLWVIGEEKPEFSHLKALALRSTDGGASWKLKLSLPNEYFFDLQFVTPECGWIVGEDGLALKSTDGGDHWQRLRPFTLQTIEKVQFLDLQRGWTMTSAEIIRTVDGGNTWQSYSPKEFHIPENQFRDFFFASISSGWLLAQKGTEDAEIFSSTDGGASWQDRTAELAALIRNSPNFNAKTESVDEFQEAHFTSAQTGYLFVNLRVKKGDETLNDVLVLKTQDGGKRWKFISRFINSFFKQIQYLSENEIWIVDSSKRCLLLTASRGKTWIKKSYSIAIDISEAPLFVFFDTREGWLMRDRQSFSFTSLYTNDGGKTWVRRQPQYIE